MLPLLAQDEDSSEEDEDLEFHKALQDAIRAQTSSIITENEPKFATYESSDFIDAYKAITENCWNSSAWELLIEEVECGRGGKITKVEIYTQATNQFPRGWKFWKRLVDHYIELNEFQLCEEAFRKCLQKCRNVDLWLSYLNLTRQKTIDKNPPNSEQYANAKRTYEGAFEKALENIGMSFDSHLIWRRYLDFVKDWPESGAIDTGRKLTALREIYQKAICNPMDDLDRYWREYEDLEMKAGEHLATQLLPEFRPKYLNAKTVFKERKRMCQGLQVDRISIPPTFDGSVSEVQQLELWNKWIRSLPSLASHDFDLI
jgi:cleavage stimulation factor subunit 3